ncbi:MAG: cytochrome c oxidase subunit II [Alphaproteobacteria bacterium]|nr:cytochrome c oxidase subunit II [Alphaproteobacteria bacterium]
MIGLALIGALALFQPALAADPVLGQPRPWQLGLQDGVTEIKDLVHDFHTLLLIIITAITLFVMVLLIYVMVRFNAKNNPVPSKTSHNTLVEVVWTVVPVMILLIIAVPSFKLLYFQDRIENPELTIKAVGHQWYWSYEYPDNGGFGFDALMVPEKDLKPGQLRLLETDNRVVLPVDTRIQVLITTEDVLHAWTVPAFGVKKDAVPGKVNAVWFNARKEGVYYGQCSELCGSLHGFMPIAVEVVSKEKFKSWVEERRKAAGLPAHDELAARLAAEALVKTAAK